MSKCASGRMVRPKAFLSLPRRPCACSPSNHRFIDDFGERFPEIDEDEPQR